MDLIIGEDVLQAARISAEELRQEIAVLLFAWGRLTPSRLVGMRMVAFQHLPASRRISPPYDGQGFDEDLETLRRLGGSTSTGSREGFPPGSPV